MSYRATKEWQHREVLRGMYEDQGLTMREIAQILGTTATTVRYWMVKHGIESRDFDIGDVNKGIQRSDEEKRRLSEIAKERFQRPEDHPMYGRRHTEEAKRKMSETKKKKRREKEMEKV